MTRVILKLRFLNHVLYRKIYRKILLDLREKLMQEVDSKLEKSSRRTLWSEAIPTSVLVTSQLMCKLGGIPL